MPTSSSASPQVIEFAGRLTFPASSDWEKVGGLDRPTMTLQFSEGGRRAQGERPVLMLYTEELEGWSRQFENGNKTNTEKFISLGSCPGTQTTHNEPTYDLPVRYTEGDIMLRADMGDGKVVSRVGEYYSSPSCDPASGGAVRHAWVFRYEDANGNQRGLMIYGFPAPHSASGFPYDKAVDLIRRGAW